MKKKCNKCGARLVYAGVKSVKGGFVELWQCSDCYNMETRCNKPVDLLFFVVVIILALMALIILI